MTVHGCTLNINEAGYVVGAWTDSCSSGYGIPYKKCWRYSNGRRYEDGWDNAWGRYTPEQAKRKIYNGTLRFY